MPTQPDHVHRAIAAFAPLLHPDEMMALARRHLGAIEALREAIRSGRYPCEPADLSKGLRYWHLVAAEAARRGAC
jgi:hypothetical protein